MHTGRHACRANLKETKVGTEIGELVPALLWLPAPLPPTYRAYLLQFVVPPFLRPSLLPAATTTAPMHSMYVPPTATHRDDEDDALG